MLRTILIFGLYRTLKNPKIKGSFLFQLSAIPIKIISTVPASLGSADADLFGEGDTGIEYCIKTVSKTPMAPAAEYVCHCLANACGFATAQFDIVQLRDGTLAFGSVWDSTALAQQQTMELLAGQIPGRGLARNLSRIYALDLFLHNGDRHPGNYLCVKGRTTGYSLKLYDFSRAFTANGWPLPLLPLNPGCQTMVTYRQAVKAHPFDLSAANEALQKIADTEHSQFKGIVDSTPSTWLNAKTKREVLKWWAGPKDKRINEIRKGLKDGSFF